MKKLLLFTMIMICEISFGQIKQMDEVKKERIGQIKDLSNEVISLERWNDGLIVFQYIDQKYSKITDFKSFSFLDVDGALDSFYNTLLDGIKAKEKKEINLELPDDILTLKFGKMMGKGYVEIYHNSKSGVSGVVQWMDEKRLNKVFGRK